jgi:hypothetical protein
MKGSVLRARSFYLLALLAVSALYLAACGGDSGGGNSDSDQIAAAIRQVSMGSAPASCKKFETQAFMEQDNQAKGKEAVKACEEDVTEVKDNPKSVAVSKVEVDGSKATADVAFKGGGFDGQVLAVALVKTGGQWKLAKAERFAKFDKANLVEQFGDELADPSNEIKKSTATCFVEALKKMSQQEIEELVLSGSSEPTAQLIETCS